jgi:hypothetical protein
MTTNNETDLRQERGRLLSQNKGIKHIAGQTWLVPSQTQPTGGYVVNTAEKTCTCPDFELRRCKCKHAWAVEFVQTFENHADGTQTVTESMSYSRTTHQQDWSAYNEAHVASGLRCPLDHRHHRVPGAHTLISEHGFAQRSVARALRRRRRNDADLLAAPAPLEAGRDNQTLP